MKLSNTLHINTVVQLHESLMSLLETDDEVCLDISDVEAVDTASIQVLCALQKSLLASKGKIKWRGTSETLLKATQLLDVATFLDLER